MRGAPIELLNVRQEARQILTWVLAALFLWGGLSRGALVTARGVQCPTAAVQAVAVAKRDCCRHVVGVEIRKPKEGEKGFVQCRCEEKRQSAVQADASPRNECLPPSVLAFVVPPPIPSGWTEYDYKLRSAAWSEPPTLRPPTAA